MFSKQLAKRFARHWCEWNKVEYSNLLGTNCIMFQKDGSNCLEAITLDFIANFEQEVCKRHALAISQNILPDTCYVLYYEPLWNGKDYLLKAKAPDELTARVEAVCRVIEKMDES